MNIKKKLPSLVKKLNYEKKQFNFLIDDFEERALEIIRLGKTEMDDKKLLNYREHIIRLNEKIINKKKTIKEIEKDIMKIESI